MLIAAALLLPPCVADETNADARRDSSVTFKVPLLSKYVWRGLLITDGPVIQPSVNVSHRGFVVDIWGNMDLDDVNGNEREFNEIDITLAYGGEVGPVSISGGVIHYTFPSTLLTDSTELFASATVDVLLRPTLSGFLDLDAAAGGTYWKVEGGHDFVMAPQSSKIPWSIGFSLGIGWGSSEHNDLYFGVPESGLTDILAAASAPIDLGRGWALVPSVAYSSMIASSLRDGVEQPDNLFGGVMAVYGF